jgi:nifR3 family TIM-barrel protein
MRDAAQMLEESGVDSIDINMGCPVDKVVRTGSGSLLMTCHQQAAGIVEAMVAAVKIPITAKMRLGWDAHSLTAPDLAMALEGAGIAAVFVHGRTREQGFSGGVDLPGIAAVVRAVTSVPVIGNGDITTPEAARFMFEQTGCAGVSIGRGAFYNPWIFSQTAALLRTGVVPAEPGFEERVAVMSRHLDRMVAFYGERKGCIFFRKVAAWYAKRLGPSVFFRRRVFKMETRAEFDEILAQYREWRRPFQDDNGELLPRYRPPPQHCTLFDVEREASAIAVPRGPNAVW